MAAKRVTEFTIDRAKWLRGKTAGRTRLLTADGGMCCLGFYAKACGIPDADLLRRPDPCDLAANTNHVTDSQYGWLVEPTSELDEAPLRNTAAAQSLMEFNDKEYPRPAEQERESAIAKEFAAQGITVTFVGNGNPIS